MEPLSRTQLCCLAVYRLGGLRIERLLADVCSIERREQPLNELRQVQITTIPGRVGQLVRNELKFQTTGGSGEARPKYRLDIALTERVTTTLVNEQGDSLSQIYSLDAAFKLTNMTGDKVILQGSSFGRASFERVSSIFANVRAREGAEVRSAKSVANDIRSRLAAFLARG